MQQAPSTSASGRLTQYENCKLNISNPLPSVDTALLHAFHSLAMTAAATKRAHVCTWLADPYTSCGLHVPITSPLWQHFAHPSA